MTSEKDSDLITFGKEFKSYLLNIFEQDADKLESIWDICPKKAISNKDNPLMTNGYNSVLIVHLRIFIKKGAEEIKKIN